ncbi:hypothetical protein PQX77_007469 [Marasmius sp. AFHP31]|nr:hypothetical protein PQX77_007469 [Marasmius sp. AFHP31]
MLVTGSNTGVGYALVKLLAQQGHRVYLSGRNEESVREAVEKLRGLDVKPVLLDVTKDESVRTAREVIENAEGRLDVLVNNAGKQGGEIQILDDLNVFKAIYPGFCKPSELSIDFITKALQVNYLGVIRVTTAFLPLIRQSTHRGIILNVSSGAGSHHYQSNYPQRYPCVSAAYYGSKAALNAYTISLAKELEVRGSGVRVHSVTPGMTVTRMTEEYGFPARRPPVEGAEVILPWATLDKEDDRTGMFVGYNNDEGRIDEGIPW